MSMQIVSRPSENETSLRENGLQFSLPTEVIYIASRDLRNIMKKRYNSSTFRTKVAYRPRANRLLSSIK